jgi:ubiquinone/menaquinone biosynthesis C-methylase UbiE
MLELGCGDGGNLIPLAEAYPQSNFVGIDISEGAIQKGRTEIAELGLHNVTLLQGDLSNTAVDEGTYDYVVCHGVYSWVAPEVQRAILKTGRLALTPSGVFLVTYNTLPGWRQRGIVRDILGVGAGSRSDHPLERCALGLDFLKLVSKEKSAITASFGAYISEALERLASSDPSYIHEEFLGQHNEPLLFTDFISRAKHEGLQFLTEARVVMMSSDDLSPAVQEYLEGLGADYVAREQALDIFRNRTFRETLLCRGEASVDRGLSIDVFKSLQLTSLYAAIDSRDLTRGFRERTSGREIVTPPGDCTNLLGIIDSFAARGACFADIFDRSRISMDLAERDLLIAAVTLWRSGFIEVTTSPLSSLERDFDTVTVTQYARLQARSHPKVTSRTHDSYSLSELERKAILMVEAAMSKRALVTLLLSDMDQDSAEALVESLANRGFL